MIEASPTARRTTPPPTSPKGKERAARRQPLYSSSRRPVPTVLPTTTSKGAPVSIPPRPSELDIDDAPGSESPSGQQHTHMRGLDAHERALWNWVNVYNLDAFLQEAYYYYEGKGIYSIALSRGLNLLSVFFLDRVLFYTDCCDQHSRVRHRVLHVPVGLRRLLSYTSAQSHPIRRRHRGSLCHKVE